MEKTVRPYIDSRRTDETVSCGGCGIFTSRFTPEGKSRGTVMIVHGFTENTEKYAEIIGLYEVTEQNCELYFDMQTKHLKIYL